MSGDTVDLLTHTAANFCHGWRSRFAGHLIGASSSTVYLIKTIALDLCFLQICVLYGDHTVAGNTRRHNLLEIYAERNEFLINKLCGSVT